MSQQCWECGRVVDFGQPLQHFEGCEHLQASSKTTEESKEREPSHVSDSIR